MALTPRIPPHSIETEQSLLGALLLDKDSMVKVGDVVAADDFYRDSHRLIYEAMVDLYRKHEPIDMLALANRLSDSGNLEKVGGRSYLIELANMVATAAHCVHYAETVQKKSTLRRMIQTAGEIANLGFSENDDVEDLLDQAERTLMNVSQKFMKKAFTPIDDVLEDAFERIDELHREKGKLRGLATGYKDLDSILGGLQKSDLVILAARPSVGKSSFALDIARFAAVKLHTQVGIFSLEMSKEQLVDRFICAEAGVDLWKMRTGRLSDAGADNEFTRIGHALGTLSEAPIFLDDSAAANIMEIRNKARRLQMEHGLGLIVVD
jgi:replicative DNA helicase